LLDTRLKALALLKLFELSEEDEDEVDSELKFELKSELELLFESMFELKLPFVYEL